MPYKDYKIFLKDQANVLLKGNAQFFQKVTFGLSINLKENHYGYWKKF